MKYRIARFALALSFSLALCPIASQAQLLDRLKKKADEVADTAEEARRGVDTVTDADAVATARVEAAANQVERQAEADARGAVESTAPAQTVREAERTVGTAEAEAARVASTDERAQAAVEGQVRQTQQALDVESRAQAEVARSEPVTTARDAERSLNQAESTLAGAQRADEAAAAEAKAKVDPRPAVDDVESALERARRSLRNIN